MKRLLRWGLIPALVLAFGIATPTRAQPATVEAAKWVVEITEWIAKIQQYLKFAQEVYGGVKAIIDDPLNGLSGGFGKFINAAVIGQTTFGYTIPGDTVAQATAANDTLGKLTALIDDFSFSKAVDFGDSLTSTLDTFLGTQYNQAVTALKNAGASVPDACKGRWLSFDCATADSLQKLPAAIDDAAQSMRVAGSTANAGASKKVARDVNEDITPITTGVKTAAQVTLNAANLDAALAAGTVFGGDNPLPLLHTIGKILNSTYAQAPSLNLEVTKRLNTASTQLSYTTEELSRLTTIQVEEVQRERNERNAAAQLEEDQSMAEIDSSLTQMGIGASSHCLIIPDPKPAFCQPDYLAVNYGNE